jgi:hypothetical protein
MLCLWQGIFGWHGAEQTVTDQHNTAGLVASAGQQDCSNQKTLLLTYVSQDEL